MLLVDTNVLVDILEDDPEWVDWSISQLRAQRCFSPPRLLCATVDKGARKEMFSVIFFIGAHAAVPAYPSLTLDKRRYTSYFPGVMLITPEALA